EWRRLIQGQILNQTLPLASEYPDANGPNTGAAIPTTSPILAPVGVVGWGANCPGGVSPVAPGSPFPGNVIPSCLISPNATSLLGAGIFPKPTSGNQFIGGNNNPTNVKEEIVRIDHRFTDKLSIFGHFIADQVSQTYGTHTVERRQCADRLRRFRKSFLSRVCACRIYHSSQSIERSFVQLQWQPDQHFSKGDLLRQRRNLLKPHLAGLFCFVAERRKLRRFAH